MNHRSVGALVVAALLLGAGPASAEVPRLINFQGHLRDANGNAKTGAYSITFRLTNAATGGTACFTETQPVPVNSGLFSVNIGDKTVGGIAQACDFSVPYWIEVQFAGDTAMAPRLPLAAVGYALHAQVASDSDTVGGFSSTALFGRAEYAVNGNCLAAGGMSCNPQCVTYVYGAWRYGGCWNGDATYNWRAPACPTGCSELGNPAEACDSITITDYWGKKYRYKKACLCNNTLHGYLKVP